MWRVQTLGGISGARGDQLILHKAVTQNRNARLGELSDDGGRDDRLSALERVVRVTAAGPVKTADGWVGIRLSGVAA